MTIDRWSGNRTQVPQMHVLIYDGTCRLCVRMAEAVRHRDVHGRIELLPAQDPTVPTRFPGLSPAALAEALHLVAPDGTVWRGVVAVERLLALMPRIRAIRWIFSIPGARPVAERVYRWIANNRRHMGCGVHCRPR